MGDTGLGRLQHLVDLARRDAALGEHIARAFDEAGSGCRDDDAPPIRQECSDVRCGAFHVALERRDRRPRHADRGGGLERDIDVVVDQTFGGGIRLSGIEGAETPPDTAAGAGSRTHGGQRQEVAGAEVDRGAGSCRRGAPRRLEELAVRVAEGDRARDGALRIDESDGRALGQIVDDGHEPIHDGREQGLHALDRDALGHLLEHAGEARQLVLELSGTAAHGVGEQQLSAGQQGDLAHLAGQRPLIGDREGAHLVHLVAEELDTVRVRCGGGKTSRMPPRTANSPRRETMSTR